MSYVLLALLSVGLLPCLGWADSRPPRITITKPTTASQYVTNQATLTIGGTATDNVGVVRVTWFTTRDPQERPATGTTSWSFTATLPAGQTVVSVRAYDAAGNNRDDGIQLTVTAPPPPPPPPGPITLEWSYGAEFGGEAFQMERCTQPCGAMAPVAVVSIADRSWTDVAVQPELDYCYRLAVLTGQQLGTYSNTLCSP